jgi:hypothetical protein
VIKIFGVQEYGDRSVDGLSERSKPKASSTKPCSTYCAICESMSSLQYQLDLTFVSLGSLFGDCKLSLIFWKKLC